MYSSRILCILHCNFSNSKSPTSFSDTSLIFSSPSKSVLTSKISDSSKSFKGPTLLHSKQSDNSNRENVSYCNAGLPITKAVDVNAGKLSESLSHFLIVTGMILQHTKQKHHILVMQCEKIL